MIDFRPAWAEGSSPDCTDAGDYWVLKNPNNSYELVVCSKKGKDQLRQLTGTELRSLIKDTLSKASARANWKKILKLKKSIVSEQDLKVYIRGIKEKDSFPLTSAGPQLLAWVGDQYSSQKSGLSTRSHKRVISKSDNSPIERSLMRTHMHSCINAGGNLVVTEEGTYCGCGRSEFANFQNFSCIGRKVVRYQHRNREPSSEEQKSVLKTPKNKTKLVSKPKKSKKTK